jgi:hypothetical protein
MERVIKTVVFHIICIIIFTFMYYSVKDDFEGQFNEKLTLIDYFGLSTTIQAGVGISDIHPNPITVYGKLLMILQQFMMIFTNVFTLYTFL